MSALPWKKRAVLSGFHESTLAAFSVCFCLVFGPKSSCSTTTSSLRTAGIVAGERQPTVKLPCGQGSGAHRNRCMGVVQGPCHDGPHAAATNISDILVRSLNDTSGNGATAPDTLQSLTTGCSHACWRFQPGAPSRSLVPRRWPAHR
jgi:hypothetical protein